jgi:hypothetical protein
MTIESATCTSGSVVWMLTYKSRLCVKRGYRNESEVFIEHVDMYNERKRMEDANASIVEHGGKPFYKDIDDKPLVIR